MTETLLFLHVLAAFFLVAGVVMYTAVALGSPVSRSSRILAEVLWSVGGLGTIILGIWLALDIDGYGVFDGWILAAIVLWFAATGTGEPVSKVSRTAAGDAALALPSRLVTLHWVRSALVLALLVVMIYKPGA